MDTFRRFLAVLALTFGLYLPTYASEARDPLSYPLRQYGVILAMTLLGGFAGWYQKVRAGILPGFTLFALIGEMATSALAGLASFFVCDWLNASVGVSAAVAGLSGYGGGRVIEWAEKILQARAERLLGETR